MAKTLAPMGAILSSAGQGEEQQDTPPAGGNNIENDQ